jgi:two-component system, NarL family, invasion response regulator UvrY
VYNKKAQESYRTLNPDQFLAWGISITITDKGKGFYFTLLDINENPNFELGLRNAEPGPISRCTNQPDQYPPNRNYRDSFPTPFLHHKPLTIMLKTNASVAIVDDHMLLRKELANLIRGLETYAVFFEANNGKDFIKQLQPRYLPDIVLLDINMPEMDGYETALWLKRNYPGIKIVALSMYDNEHSIIRMMKNGAKGYILKDIDPMEFRSALNSLIGKGFYYSELITSKLIHAVSKLDDAGEAVKSPSLLNVREREFLKLVCTEMTYKEIAEKMFLSARTIDGYRDALFEKLNVKSRVGLVLYAIKHNIVNVYEQV